MGKRLPSQQYCALVCHQISHRGRGFGLPTIWQHKSPFWLFLSVFSDSDGFGDLDGVRCEGIGSPMWDVRNASGLGCGGGRITSPDVEILAIRSRSFPRSNCLCSTRRRLYVGLNQPKDSNTKVKSQGFGKAGTTVDHQAKQVDWMLVDKLIAMSNEL